MRARIALSTAVLAVGVTGCGSTPLSKAEYVKQADAICTSFQKKQKALGNPASVKDIQSAANKAKPLVEDEIKQLRALKAPDAIKDDASDAYDLLDQTVPKIDDLVAAAKKNDVKAIQSIATSAGKLNDQASVKAKKIGLKVCGTDS